MTILVFLPVLLAAAPAIIALSTALPIDDIREMLKTIFEANRARSAGIYKFHQARRIDLSKLLHGGEIFMGCTSLNPEWQPLDERVDF